MNLSCRLLSYAIHKIKLPLVCHSYCLHYMLLHSDTNWSGNHQCSCHSHHQCTQPYMYSGIHLWDPAFKETSWQSFQLTHTSVAVNIASVGSYSPINPSPRPTTHPIESIKTKAPCMWRSWWSWVTLTWHVDPLAQGLESHSLMSSSQFTPV